MQFLIVLMQNMANQSSIHLGSLRGQEQVEIAIKLHYIRLTNLAGLLNLNLKLIFQTHLHNVQDQLYPPKPYSTQFHFMFSLLRIPISFLCLFKPLFRSILLLSALLLSCFLSSLSVTQNYIASLQFAPFNSLKQEVYLSPHPAIYSKLSQDLRDGH